MLKSRETSGILTPAWFVVAATSKKTLSAGAISGIVIGGLFVILAVAAYAYLQKRRADRLKKREDPFGTVSHTSSNVDVKYPLLCCTMTLAIPTS